MVEQLMVAMISPLMRIKFLKRGTRALAGNCIAFRQPVQRLYTALPRYVSETSVLFVVRGLVDDEDKDSVARGAKQFKLRREVVRRALLWLMAHCPPYQQHGVHLDEGRMRAVPVDGSVFDAARNEKVAKSVDSSEAPVDCCVECRRIPALCQCHVRYVGEDGKEKQADGQYLVCCACACSG